MLAQRRTKIVATIGPSTQQEASLEALIFSGMNVARLNFSHGQHEDHLQVIRKVRALSERHRAPVALLQDLQGPKIRVGRLQQGRVDLVRGQSIDISPAQILGDSQCLSTDFKELPEVCSEGTRILLDDGKLELKVTGVLKDRVQCEVVYGGPLTERKGINLPGVSLPVDCLTEKDLVDLEFGLKHAVDYVALSFVRQGADIRKLREIIQEKSPQTKIVAKIEMLEALDNLEDIVDLSDAVMVARGDLTVEVGASQLPLTQKKIIHLCNQKGRPVITATQMLDSMVENPSPTRAEITDVANAVLDGSDALMLSAETASGKYPDRCVKTMHDIILEVEKEGSVYYDFDFPGANMETAESIASSAAHCARNLNSPVILCLSSSGRTATLISQRRPKAQIIACTKDRSTLNRLELVWGIQTLEIGAYSSSEEAMAQIQAQLLSYGIVKTGDSIILTLGMPIQQGAKTNTLRVYQVSASTASAAPITPLRWTHQK